MLHHIVSIVRSYLDVYLKAFCTHTYCLQSTVRTFSTIKCPGALAGCSFALIDLWDIFEDLYFWSSIRVCHVIT